ncbi:MAG: hypothetical protein AB1641_00080 [Thermodesulfobacteriota bacterium]
MKELADLLADEDTVLRGYIAVKAVKVVGHKCLGPDRTLAVSFSRHMEEAKQEDVLWCLVEKERGRAPLLYPVVLKPDEDEESSAGIDKIKEGRT